MSLQLSRERKTENWETALTSPQELDPAKTPLKSAPRPSARKKLEFLDNRQQVDPPADVEKPPADDAHDATVEVGEGADDGSGRYSFQEENWQTPRVGWDSFKRPNPFTSTSSAGKWVYGGQSPVSESPSGTQSEAQAVADETAGSVEQLQENTDSRRPGPDSDDNSPPAHVALTLAPPVQFRNQPDVVPERVDQGTFTTPTSAGGDESAGTGRYSLVEPGNQRQRPTPPHLAWWTPPAGTEPSRVQDERPRGSHVNGVSEGLPAPAVVPRRGSGRSKTTCCCHAPLESKYWFEVLLSFASHRATMREPDRLRYLYVV